MLVNMNFWQKKDILTEKKLLEKAATIKTLEYFPLGSELKKKSNWHCKKKYQRLDKIHGFDKKNGVKKLTKIKKSQI